MVGEQLPQDPCGGGGVGLQRYPAAGAVLRRMMDRNASSSD
jgi:hypothetical protein